MLGYARNWDSARIHGTGRANPTYEATQRAPASLRLSAPLLHHAPPFIHFRHHETAELRRVHAHDLHPLGGERRSASRSRLGCSLSPTRSEEHTPELLSR